jgi:hypothetical protein
MVEDPTTDGGSKLSFIDDAIRETSDRHATAVIFITASLAVWKTFAGMACNCGTQHMGCSAEVSWRSMTQQP